MNARTAQPPQLSLGSAEFFLNEVQMLLGMFAAAQDMDDWDLARAAFLALSQNAWAAHAMNAESAPLRCPVSEPAACAIRVYKVD